MNVLGLGDEFDFLVAGQTIVVQHVFEFDEFMTVNDQQFVFVELDFPWHFRIQNSDTGAAISQQQIFKFVKTAFENGEIDIFAIQVLVLARLIVAGLKHDIDFVSQRFNQIQKQFHQDFTAC